MCVALVFMMSGEAALSQKKPQASQTVEFTVGRVRQVSIRGLAKAGISAYIPTRGTTKVTVGPPGSKKAGFPFQRQLVILSTRADSLFTEDAAPLFEGEAVYTITE
jgi:hypothetical protein